MKEKLAIVIAALLITSMALSIPTTSVTALPGATFESTYARANTRVKFTVTVTNDTADNIDNVRIFAPSGSGFTEAIGGVETAENLKLAADNLENAVAPLKWAGENLKLAADNKESDAGPAVSSAGTSLQTAAIRAAILVMENEVGVSIEDAGLSLEQAGDNIAAASENFTLIASLLNNAAAELHAAAGSPAGTGENMWMENNNPAAAENLDNAAAKIGYAATALEGGSLRRAGENLKIAGDNLENTGTALGGAAGSDFTSAGTSLRNAGQALIDAAQYDNLAGINLVDAAAYLQSAGSYIELADTTDLKAAGDNLENAAADSAGSIKAAGENLKLVTDDVVTAGDALSSAATYLATAATELGVALGGDELEDAMEHENAAAENLNVGDVDLGTAGQQLIYAADDLSAAATKLLATADALAPATWDMSDAADYVLFDAFGDNVITPGSSETFVFLWTTPDTSGTENTYTITIASNKEGGGDAHWITQATITLTIDGEFPTLTIVVTQTGVATVNVVGTVLDNARATITITASETLQSIGTVYLENVGGLGDNLQPPIENTALTKVDEKTYKYEYITVGAWDENGIKVRVASAKDLAGNENTNMENTVTVDTRAPIFIENGLAELIDAMGRTNVTQAGTGTVFAYVDNSASQSLIIRVEDNIDSADNGKYVTSVTIDTAAATRSAVVDNLWSMDPLTLSAGFNSVITVTATDRTGNTVSDNVENIFIDTQPPTIEFNTIAGETWTSGVPINDDTPEIKITVKDPGYSTSGLGVADENLKVYLDNDDNFLNTPPTWGGLLENKGPWDFGLAGVFENVIDNAGSGFVEGTYYIWVFASDNLAHDTKENENSVRSFIIDVTAPSSPPKVDLVGNVPAGFSAAAPETIEIGSITLAGTAEADATIKVYITTDSGITWTATSTTPATITADATGHWVGSLTVSSGVNTGIAVTATDVAGNESTRTLFGYVFYFVDAVAPTTTITAPETGITTDAASITVTGSVSKDTWEAYTDLTVTIQVGSATPGDVTLATDGSFTITAALTEGPNTIVIKATDESGNVGSDFVTATRTITPWATYAIIIVIVALIMAAIAIFRKR